MKRTTFCLTEKIMAQIKQASKDTGLSMSDIVRRAVELYFRQGKRTWRE